MGCGSSSKKPGNVENAKGGKKDDLVAALSKVDSKLLEEDLAELHAAKGKKLNAEEKAMLKEFPELWTDPDFYKNHMEQVWKHYDKHHHGYLSKQELMHVVKDAVHRYVEIYRVQLHKENSHLTEAELDKQVTNDIPYLLPGKNLHDIKKNCLAALIQELNLHDKHGTIKIQKAEFFLGWDSAHKKLFESKASKTEDAGDMKCSVM